MQKIAGVLATAVVCSLLLLYQNVVALKGVDSPLEQDHTKKESTLEGYEEPEEAVGYLLYQVQQRNLDAALRICAVRVFVYDGVFKSYRKFSRLGIDTSARQRKCCIY